MSPGGMLCSLITASDILSNCRILIYFSIGDSCRFIVDLLGWSALLDLIGGSSASGVVFILYKVLMVSFL